MILYVASPGKRACQTKRILSTKSRVAYFVSDKYVTLERTEAGSVSATGFSRLRGADATGRYRSERFGVR